jgi:hypothetical protein
LQPNSRMDKGLFCFSLFHATKPLRYTIPLINFSRLFFANHRGGNFMPLG